MASKDIGAVLAGARSYDSLGSKERAVVRTDWAARMDALREGLDLAASFREAGHGWVELDAEGDLVERRVGATKGAARKAPSKRARAAG